MAIATDVLIDQSQAVPSEWVISAPPGVIAELEQAATQFTLTDDAPVFCLDGLSLNTVHTWAPHIRAQLQTMPVIIKGFPVDDAVKAKKIWAAFFQCLYRTMPQKVNGVYTYEVRDKAPQFGQGVRRSITNQFQPQHTDGSFLTDPPHYMGLFFVRQSQTGGGKSRLVNMREVYDFALGDQRLINRLRKPFCWNMQDEVLPGELGWSVHPALIDNDGVFKFWWYADYMITGHDMAAAVDPELALDDDGYYSIETIDDVLADPDVQTEFMMEPGDALLVNNYEYAHGRTKFEPVGEVAPDTDRLVYRSWGS